MTERIADWLERMCVDAAVELWNDHDDTEYLLQVTERSDDDDNNQ